MHATHNEGKSVVAERSIWTWKNKIYKHMTPKSKSVYIDKLDEIVNKHNNTYHSTIKIKAGDVKNNFILTLVNNDKGPKFKVVDQVIISKYTKSLQGVTV